MFELFRKDKTKGITLIALVITIIVMLILAGVSITTTIGENGILTRAREATFKQALSQYKSDVELYIVNYTVNDITKNEDQKSLVYAGDREKNTYYDSHFKDLNKLSQSASGTILENLSIDTIITNGVDEGYITNVAVETGDLIWFDNDVENEKVKWCLELGISVFIEGSGLITPEGYVIYSEGNYAQKGSISYCQPDLTGFNTGKTYYLTYKNDNQTSVAEYPIYYNVPEDWYDYENQRWANIITVSDCQMSYWTWIPRYMYKIESGQPKIKFVNTANTYIGEDGTKTQAQLEAEGYLLPESFKFNNSDLPGIWVSKYEISNPIHPTGFATTVDARKIQITRITTIGSSVGTGVGNEIENKVTINISGGGIERTISDVSLPYTIEDLSPNTTYSISLTTPTVYEVNMVLTKELTTSEGDIQELSNPDLTGFNNQTTYFVTYDENNKTSTIGNKISTKSDTIAGTEKLIAANPPSNWYDYSKQRWANIVTITEDGRMSYWTWIPRYQYKVDETMDTTDCIFISKNITSPTAEGYEIPESFKFGGKEVSGIWVAKYEVEDVQVPVGFAVQTSETNVRITEINYGGGSAISSGTMPNTGIIMKVYLNNSTSPLKTETISIPSGTGYTIDGLTPGQNYKISLQVPLSYKKANGDIQYVEIEKQITTLGTGNSVIEEPDLNGFDAAHTYYITYDTVTANAKIAGHINQLAPAGWYDYANRKWANIAVSTDVNLPVGTYIVDLLDSTKVNMFVWVPRYEYKVDETADSVDSRFISKSTNVPTSGYQIPDAFTFNGSTLPGIWVSKYEVQSTDDEDFSN